MMIFTPRVLAALSAAAMVFTAGAVLVTGQQHPPATRKPAHVAACPPAGCWLSRVHAPVCGGGWASGPAEAAAVRARKETGCP